jgi:drug/metabolite transporter (DMT)-like permease
MGSFLAIFSAIFFALTMIFIRRGVVKVPEASLGILISVPMAVPLYFIILAVIGQTQQIFSFSWRAYIWLSLAGISHFVIGRSLSYRLVQMVGANLAGILRRANILVSFVIGISLLGEPLSGSLVAGVLLIITGITLPGMGRRMFRDADGRLSKIPARAFALGLGCSLAFGISPIFIKLGLAGSQSPVAGAFIAFVAATVVLSASLIHPNRRMSMAGMSGSAAGLFVMAGLLGGTANLLRFAALKLSPASTAVPLVSISPIFVIFLSFVFNRQLEIFNRFVIMGTVMVVIGSILIV